MPAHPAARPASSLEFDARELGDQEQRRDHVEHVEAGEQRDRRLERVARGQRADRHRPEAADRAAASGNGNGQPR